MASAVGYTHHEKDPSPTDNITISSIHITNRLRPLGNIAPLMESISQIGLLNPITITHTHRLIAGFHRLEACKAIGWITIPAKILDIGDNEAELLECDENLIRNDLTVLERAEHYQRRKQLYEELHRGSKHGGWRGNRYTGGIVSKTKPTSFCWDAGQKTNRSSRTIQKLIQIANRLDPQAKELLRRTQWAHNQLTLQKLTKLPSDVQIAVAEKVASGEAHLLNDAVANVHQDRFRAMPTEVPIEGREYRLLHGDFRDVGHQIADESVELILTDAPYETPDLYVFKPLSVFANRVLKPGGSLLCMAGQYHLPRILADLSECLEYQWTIAALFNGMATFIPNRLVNCSYKPVLWFVKPPYRGKAIRDVITSGKRDKRFHPHGQSVDEFAKLIRWFTVGGDTVVDCFVGGGTTAVAALSAGRKFIGVDVEAKHIQTTRGRIGQLIRKEPLHLYRLEAQPSIGQAVIST